MCCLGPYTWRRGAASIAQAPEDYTRDIQIFSRFPNAADELTAAVSALFDTAHMASVNIISYSLVLEKNLGPVVPYPVAHPDITTPAAGTLPLRIIGELEAWWRGIDRDVHNPRISFAPKCYCSRFLVTDDQLDTTSRIIFSLQTVQELGLFGSPGVHGPA